MALNTIQQGFNAESVIQNQNPTADKKRTTMRGNTELIEAMNSLLKESLAAQNQSMVHAEICESWGYKKLLMAFRMQVIDQMRRSEWLIERIVFLGGTPRITKLNTIIKLGKTVTEMIANEKDEEQATLKAYNSAIILAREVKDQGSVEMLTRILKLEEKQIAWVEAQLTQIEQMGLEIYLSDQTMNDVN
jgi:bacterioferritin